MASTVYVDPPVEDGRRLLAALDAGGFSVAVAAWLQSPDSGRWSLYIVTPAAGPGRTRVASAQAREAVIASQAPPPLLNDFLLYAPTEPVGRDLVAARTTWALGEPIRGTGGRFGDVEVDGLYIYPTRFGKTTWQLFYDVVDALYALNIPDVTVHLHDHTTRVGRPVSIGRSERGEMCLNLYDRQAGQTVTLGAGEIVDIRRLPGTPRLPQPAAPPAAGAA